MNLKISKLQSTLLYIKIKGKRLREMLMSLILEISKRKKKLLQSCQIHSTAHFVVRLNTPTWRKSIYIDHLLSFPGFLFCDFCLASNQFLGYVRTLYYLVIWRQDFNLVTSWIWYYPGHLLLLSMWYPLPLLIIELLHLLMYMVQFRLGYTSPLI